MNVILEQIERLLLEEDIEGLIAAGAPEDEYHSEATEIYMAISDDSVAGTEIQDIIERIWQRSFNLTRQNIVDRKASFERISNNIAQA